MGDPAESFDEPTWTFARGVDELTIGRRIDSGGVTLTVSVNSANAHVNSSNAHTYEFPDLATAMRRQAEMEASLIKFGWSFVGFLPQRRSHDERRGMPRATDDRRRWWTDGYIFDLDL